MTQIDFEKGVLVAAAWQLASTSDVNEILAVACVVRNAVMRHGSRCYGDAITRFLRSCPLRDLPRGNEPQLVDPGEGLLSKIDGVYDNTFPDITASSAFPLGASVFGRDPELARGRQLIGRFGGMAFYA